MQHSQIVSFLWGVANLLRDTFKRGKYQDVILPLTVLRRLDCVLAPTKAAVLAANAEYRDQVDNLDNLLRARSGFAFYNTSLYDFGRLVGDAPALASNLRNYINGFSPNMRQVIDKFDFDNTISKLDDAGLLFQVVEQFGKVDLHPDAVPNHAMGTVFEELIRRFNEALNENPGEHFTPRDVVHLMADLMLAGDEERLRQPGVVITVADPCCGTGGMLAVTRDHVLGSEERQGINPQAQVFLFGQEVNPETLAICKLNLLMKDSSGRDADHVLYGSTLERDLHAGRHFDYQIANPPYGKDWKRDKEAVEKEAERGDEGRFQAGTPRISDGQLLFLQHMLSHMKPVADGGSRVAIIMNGSPLFTGDAGSGESEIRCWILENDWLEALVALPEQLFYNTGIATYVWLLSNRKPPERRGKVQLIDATDLWAPMRKSLGDKRREIPEEKAAEILDLHAAYEESKRSKIFPTTHFGYRKVRVERPLQLAFEASAERIARLEDERTFQNLAKSRKKDKEKKAAEEEAGRAEQERIRELLAGLGEERLLDRKAFRKALKGAAKEAGVKLTVAVRKAIESALGERDEEAAVCVDAKGDPEPDGDLRDYENVPLGKDVEEYFAEEVRPYVPDAWIDEGYVDGKDGEVGRVGYEINFPPSESSFVELAREVGLSEFRFAELFEVIRPGDRDLSALDVIHIPLHSFGTVTVGSMSHRYSGHILRLRERAPTTLRYLEFFFNSSAGRDFRESLARSRLLTRRDLKTARFYLPPLEIQRECEKLHISLELMESELELARRKLWEVPTQVHAVRSDFLKLGLPDLDSDDLSSMDRVFYQAWENETLWVELDSEEENHNERFEESVLKILRKLVKSNARLLQRAEDDKVSVEGLTAHLLGHFNEKKDAAGLSISAILSDIRGGEDDYLEMKSSVRFNLETAEFDKRITHGVMKTLAGFQNADGGVLYLGVADDGTILGIEHDDFVSLDAFLRYLKDKAKSLLGTPAATRMKMKIYEVRGRSVCRVECERSPRPVFLCYQGTEEFYVRVGPSTERLTASQMHEYMKDRFVD